MTTTLDVPVAVAPLAALVPFRYISLTTFRRSGTPVSTPVWWAPSADGRKGFVVTSLKSGKVKRLRHTGRVALAPSTPRGEVLGAPISANARLLPTADSAVATRAILARYGLMAQVFRLLWWLTRQPPVFLEITPD